MKIVGSGDIRAEVAGVVGPWPMEDASGWCRILDAGDLSAEQRAALYDLADAQLWTVDPPRNATARLYALLSPTQHAQPLDEVVWSTLRGVSTIEESSQGLRRRKLLVATEDVGTTPLGEAALLTGRVAAVVVEYRYRLSGVGLVEEQARVRYPRADGAGDVLVTPAQSTPVLGPETIGAGRARRVRATTRAGYLLAAGAVAHAQDPTHDPGPQVTHLLGGLSSLAGYDLVAAFERSGDPTVVQALTDYTGAHDAWLDLDLGLGFTARGLALYELAEPSTDDDGWTSWPG